MSGRPLPFIGSRDPWHSGPVTAHAICVLAPNPSPWTLDGTNTWLVASAGASIVIDPGPDDALHRAAVTEAAEQAEAPVREIVLTHGHADHSAGARALAARTGARVRAVDPQHRLGDEGLPDGARVAAGDAVVEVLATPGHSADSVSLLLEADGALLTGDTVLGRGTSVVAWPDGRLADYLDSLRRLRDVVGVRDVEVLLPGHGPRLADPGAVLDAYLDHRQARLDQVREALASGARDAEAVVSLVYADVPEAVRPAALLTVRAQLEYLGVDRG